MIPYVFQRCERAGIKDFIEKWHYSKSINGLMVDYCFKLVDDSGAIVAAMIFGRQAMADAWRKYGKQESDVIELRRLCCIDDTPRNTESFFIGKALRWLQLNTDIKTVVSYADPEYGHSGVVYKASNFKLVGTTAKGKVIYWNGKKYHDKSIRTKYKGILKPFALRLLGALAAGEAYYAKTQGKNIYVYSL
jgi:hypothetical protein